MTIGASTGLRNISRGARSTKFSASKVRSNQHGSGISGGGSTLGGQPLGSLPGGSKGEIKHRFEITKKLGSGTYGKVSLAYDHKTEKEVAVKLIKKSAIENKQDLVRIRREIRIMSALKHPNIIQIFEVFENRDKIILVMEYASGGELYDYVSAYGSLPEPEARRIFRQITSAVLYCHKHKVAHRDLKLENILLDGDNNAKIADFGLSNYFSDESLLNTFCGSPLYASPEIINGTPYRGPEVDCWSLGILLYTLVYGSMPFDGRDFNRMVRQIKRGAYFEPDTPSTASMLIRNMLRVNPGRRADIDEIASHWWLNLDENMPVIQELPENQIVDHTPLTERAETMVVQDLTDDADVFMDFGHLSASTRLKIEEFRRRRKEAEEYLEKSPIKPPKAKRADGTEAPTLTAAEKSLRYDPRLNMEKERERVSLEEADTYHEPLERLKRLESRLQNVNRDSQPTSDGKLTKQLTTASANKEIHCFKAPSLGNGSSVKDKIERISPEQPDDPVTSNSKISEKSRGVAGYSVKPSFVPLHSDNKSVTTITYRKPSLETWKIETDSLNVLMNQVLEQMEKGPVSMTLVARIKAHPLYDLRPMVKELLESIIAAQPPSVQKEASKLIQQQSQELVKRQEAEEAVKRSSKISEVVASPTAKMDDKREIDKKQSTDATQRNAPAKSFEERPWHSVEVGFDPDEDIEQAEGTSQQFHHTSENTEEIVPDTSFEDESDEEIVLESVGSPAKTKVGEIHKEVLEKGQECRDEDGFEESDSEIDELGKEVEQIEDEENELYRTALSKQNAGDSNENNPPPDPHTKVVPPRFVEAFDRGLAKRQSKGKYQHSKVELYGRGVSMECESPTLPHRRIGGPQPTVERSPFLFDKAKKYIMTYPKPIDDSSDDIPGRVGRRIAKNWLRTQDPDIMASSGENPSFPTTPTASRVGSLPSRSPPNETKSEGEEVSESEDDESEGEENEEEESIPKSQAHQSTPVMEPAGNKQQLHMTDSEVKLNAGDTTCQMELKGEENANQTNSETLTKPSKANKNSSEAGSVTVPLHEATALFVRRYNWNRRRRNRTIGVSENILKSIGDSRDEMAPGRHAVGSAATTTSEPKTAVRTRTPTTPVRPLSPGSAVNENNLDSSDPSYIHHRSQREANDKDLRNGGNLNSIVYGQSGRYHDDNLKKLTDNDAIPPTHYNLGSNHRWNLSRDDRKKSKSAHDLSPDRPDQYTATGISTKLNLQGSSNFGRHDNESSLLQSWALEPKRYYVYQTRAEREAEKNTAVSNLHPSSTYRIVGSSWYASVATGDRSGSTYMSDYKSRHDDNYSYRRNSAYEPDPKNNHNHNAELTPGIHNQANPEQPPVSPHRYRPLGKHVATVLPSIRRGSGRSHSMDRNALHPEDVDYFGFRNRFTPELSGTDKGEYSYINYHDTAARSSTPHEPDHSRVPTRGILKNRQNIENERRISTETASAGNDKGLLTEEKDFTPAASGVKHVFDRLKRHLSAEKSTSPVPTTNTSQGLGFRNHIPLVKNPDNGESTQHTSNVKNIDEAKISKEPSKAAKKRSLFQNLGRRRTTEMRLGPDGKIVISGTESEFKRPSSPIEKIKSLFRKSKESVAVPAVFQPVSSSYAHHDYVNFPSTASTRYGLTDNAYGVYPLSHLKPSVTREPFMPQHRKYAVSVKTGPAIINYSRYSYTPGASDRSLRHWHEDPHLY